MLCLGFLPSSGISLQHGIRWVLYICSGNFGTTSSFCNQQLFISICLCLSSADMIELPVFHLPWKCFFNGSVFCTCVSFLVFLQSSDALSLMWLDCLDEVLLPSLSLLPCNCSIAEETWSMLKCLPYQVRYGGRCVQLGWFLTLCLLMLARDLSLTEHARNVIQGLGSWLLSPTQLKLCLCASDLLFSRYRYRLLYYFMVLAPMFCCRVTSCSHGVITVRYRLYGQWKNTSYLSDIVILQARGTTMDRTRYVMKWAKYLDVHLLLSIVQKNMLTFFFFSKLVQILV